MRQVGVSVEDFAAKFGISLDLVSCSECGEQLRWTDIECISGYRCILSDFCKCGGRFSRCVPVGDKKEIYESLRPRKEKT